MKKLDQYLLGWNLLKQNKFVKPEEQLRPVVSYQEEKEPKAWTTFNAQSLLGCSLLGQKNYSDAESMLLKGYAGLTEQGKTTPRGGEDRISETLDNLIVLYTATNKLDDLKKWQTERVKYPEVLPKPKKKP